MKAKNWFAMVALAGLGLMADAALAQGNEQTESTPPPVSEEAASAGEETEPYNETVTIDSGAAEASSAGASDAGIAGQPEKKERLRVYSGKHDGNNVIYDPR